VSASSTACSHGLDQPLANPPLVLAEQHAAELRESVGAVLERPEDRFISNALAHGLTIFEVARVAGASPKMIELHYGSLLDSARESLLERLEAPEHTAAEAAKGGTR
jgi:hypothetical protein